MDWQEAVFWIAILVLAIIFCSVPDVIRHRHKDYKRHTTFRKIIEREAYERWNDEIPVVSETRERIRNADWVQVEKPDNKRTSPHDKVKSMMGG